MSISLLNQLEALKTHSIIRNNSFILGNMKKHHYQVPEPQTWYVTLRQFIWVIASGLDAIYVINTSESILLEIISSCGSYPPRRFWQLRAEPLRAFEAIPSSVTYRIADLRLDFD
jgi:hypothetical protein